MKLILLVFALVCFVLASFPISGPHAPRLVSLGLACLTASMILP